MLDFAASDRHVILKVTDRRGVEKMIGMVSPDYEYNVHNYFGSNNTKLPDMKGIYSIDMVTPKLV